jgi:hypothetical protein
MRYSAPKTFVFVIGMLIGPMSTETLLAAQGSIGCTCECRRFIWSNPGEGEYVRGQSQPFRAILDSEVQASGNKIVTNAAGVQLEVACDTIADCLTPPAPVGMVMRFFKKDNSFLCDASLDPSPFVAEQSSPGQSFQFSVRPLDTERFLIWVNTKTREPKTTKMKACDFFDDQGELQVVDLDATLVQEGKLILTLDATLALPHSTTLCNDVLTINLLAKK